jgi:hypothetical protein
MTQWVRVKATDQSSAVRSAAMAIQLHRGGAAINDAAQSAQGLEGLCPWERLELASLTP